MLSSQWCRRATLFVLLVLLALSHFGDHLNADEASPVTLSERVTVEIYEGLPDKRSWEIEFPAAVERYELPAFGVVCTPKKYSRDGVLDTRPYPFLVSLAARIALPAGEHRLLLRSRNAARLLIDGRPVTETAFLNPNASGHEHVPKTVVVDNRLPPLPAGQQESVVDYLSDGMPHEIRLLAIVGGNKLRPEIGEVFVAVMTESEPPQLLSPGQMPALSTENWSEYVADCYERQHLADRESRHHAATEAATYWTKRHEIARLEMAKQADVVPPPVKNVSAVNNAIDKFIIAKLEQAGIEPAPLTDDEAFLRRVTLDVVGVIPTPAEIASFASVATPRDRRPIWISKLLMDHRWADHWMGYWQDVLAENPGILKPTLNNTGPFRWWIHESFSDNKPFDQFVTELIRMDGGQWSGGPAGFAMATQNDAPMAAKAHVLAKAFLGIEMQCARCHDAPFHPFKQHELFSLAAMLSRKPEKVPATSSVVLAERSRRPLIEVTLEPGVPVDPNWPFASLASAEFPSDMLRATDDSREKLAAIITSPWNSRFAQVIVNRLWQRYLGMGLVEPVDDWNDAKPSHPELLDFLARELVQNDYDLKHVARLILESQTYQRAVKAAAQPANGEAPIRLFASPVRRRLSAEQVIDSLFVVAGKEIRAEELTMDPEGRRPVTEMQNLGVPSRAWEFTSLSNERDRPALSLPVAQSVVDVLTSFGWRESRQNPLTVREEVATPAQPMIVANGVVGNRITRFSEDSALTELALTGPTPESLTTSLFRQVLSRDPSAEELGQIANVLRDGYSQRIVDSEKAPPKKKPRLSTAVSWSNHLSPEATKIKLELEQAAREGDAPTKRLKSEWRERAEDVVWALLNSPEFIFVP